MGRQANRLATWGMLLAGPTLLGTSCVVDAYRTVRGDIGDLIRYYDDDDCCDRWDDDWDDLGDDIEDIFDDIFD
ncbi:MAG TPA: hypothetical protein P5572_22025 [Phycisphaerae bacterium]|nr:hypothetical protein [Phycisphaerales bacterium]HRX87714.1 hypothetical protein [Phycisphaerae bacterium]